MFENVGMSVRIRKQTEFENLCAKCYEKLWKTKTVKSKMSSCRPKDCFVAETCSAVYLEETLKGNLRRKLQTYAKIMVVLNII